jgi:ribose transport system substrate-binding protein
MKKTRFFLLAFCLFTGFFISCKQNANVKNAPKSNVVIAIIPKVDNEIFDQVKESALEAGKELGITITWEAPTSNDGKKQVELIENLIHYKVDGILISCNDAELLKEPIDKAIKAGIKVGTLDSDCPTSNRIFYVGTDNKKAGEVCAQTMLKLFDKDKKKPNKIIVLSGGANAENMKERLNGFRSVINQNNIEDVLFSFEMSDYGKELIGMSLKKNKKINGVQMLWSLPVLQGVDSIPALSKFMDRGGVSVFFDVSKPLLKYIKDHPNCATMKQDFHSMGYDGVKNMYNAIMDKSYQMQILYNVKVIDQSNAEEELKKL